MRNYIYTANGETKIEDKDTYILLEKESQPTLKITKHNIYAMGPNGFVPIKRQKAQNLVKNFRENVIKEGLRNGNCKAV